MATTLLEALQQSRQEAPAGVPSPGATEEARRLLLARTGKAGAAAPGATPRLSSLGEQAAIGQAQAGLGQVAQQEALTGQQQALAAEGITEQARAGRTAIEQQRRGQALQDRIATQQLLREAEEGRRQLSFDRDKAALEQIAHGLAMQDQRYVDTLQREAARKRLDNESNFMLEYQRAALGDAERLLRDRLGTASLLEARDRDLKKFIAQMNIQDAFDIAKAEMARQNIAEKWGGGAEVVKGGIQYAATRDKLGGEE